MDFFQSLIQKCRVLCIGVITSLESPKKVNRNIYHLVDLNLLTVTPHPPFPPAVTFKTVEFKNLFQALEYYKKRDKTLISLSLELMTYFDDKRNSKDVADFIRRYSFKAAPLREAQHILKSIRLKHEDFVNKRINESFLEHLLVTYDQEYAQKYNAYILMALKSGVNPNGKTSRGVPFIVKAFQNSRFQLSFFLRFGANPNLRFNDLSLAESALRHDMVRFQLLMDYGADPFTKTKSGVGLLKFAKLEKNKDAVKMIAHYQSLPKQKTKTCKVIPSWKVIFNSCFKYFDTCLDRISNGILSYSAGVVDSCPSYFSRTNFDPNPHGSLNALTPSYTPSRSLSLSDGMYQLTNSSSMAYNLFLPK